MIILEAPYVSPELSRYLADSAVPVLANDFARALPDAGSLNLTDADAFARAVNGDKRLYTISEAALAWVRENIQNESLLRGLDVMKDKALLRETLRPLYPGYFFRRVSAEGLADIDPAELPYPVVLKPAVGFFSVGVHVIADEAGWRRAIGGIARQRGQWNKQFAEAVVGNEQFIIEAFITGDEFAVDAYYDADGKAVVVNIMKHDFTSDSDVSDRLYYTSAALIRETLDEFTSYLNRVGEILRLRDFPLHVELRKTASGELLPIEFNPLRFAGLCCTDLTLFAYGYRTYDLYLNNRAPDWDKALARAGDDLYSLIILDKPASLPEAWRFDYDALGRSVTGVMNMRRFAGPELPVFGFLFARTPRENRAELDRIMHSDLLEYVKPE